MSLRAIVGKLQRKHSQRLLHRTTSYRHLGYLHVGCFPLKIYYPRATHSLKTPSHHPRLWNAQAVPSLKKPKA